MAVIHDTEHVARRRNVRVVCRTYVSSFQQLKKVCPLELTNDIRQLMGRIEECSRGDLLKTAERLTLEASKLSNRLSEPIGELLQNIEHYNT